MDAYTWIQCFEFKTHVGHKMRIYCTQSFDLVVFDSFAKVSSATRMYRNEMLPRDILSGDGTMCLLMRIFLALFFKTF